MKALILAAGYGTRLMPYTKNLPKPLFPLNSKPLLKRIIDDLIDSGCNHIFINTHHLHEKIENYISSQKFNIPVETVYEKEILNTGGAVLNILKKTDTKPFIVVNSDIYTNIDFKKLYNFHISSKNKVTLSLLKNRFNNVYVENNKVKGFGYPDSEDTYTFTGVQVINPEFKNFFEFYKSSIDAYKKMLSKKIEIAPFFPARDTFFDDLGTIESFKKNSLSILLKENFSTDLNQCKIQKLAGDGSDRDWYKLICKNSSLILGDHGICLNHKKSQANSFISIGNHLHKRNINVPRIYCYDLFTGLVITSDLGDIRLEDYVKNKSPNNIKDILKLCIDELFKFSTEGIKGFTPHMTYQTAEYNKEVSFKECLYFMDEFLLNYKKIKIDKEKLIKEFEYISKNAAEKSSFKGLMHRDFQSRNIMIQNGCPYIIDFQGARKGPVEYDIASLLIDPYLNLEPEIKKDLFLYALKSALEKSFLETEFENSYFFCALSRNLHILGAFSFLSLKKNKIYFKSYIQPAIKSLKSILNCTDNKNIKYLKQTVSKI
ncbi:MAG: sugar phosphate nucleotidyltransferase [Thermodesulfobacteriota bacterium]